jgi:hypothetical protein
MTFGLVQYVLGARHLGNAGLEPAQAVDDRTKIIAAVVAGALCWWHSRSPPESCR